MKKKRMKTEDRTRKKGIEEKRECLSENTMFKQ